jgi:carbonic anhydrase
MRTLTVLADSEQDGANPNQTQPKLRNFSLGDHGQSPIHLTNPLLVDIKPVEFYYPEQVSIEVVHTQFSVQANVTTPGAYIILDGNRYDLQGFHTHVPSEHLIEERSYHFELHLVHRNVDTGIFAVIGIVATTDPALTASILSDGPLDQSLNKDLPLVPFIEILKAAEPKKKTEDQAPLGKTTIKIEDLLPKDRRRFRYLGSFTTAPYTEIIDWNVIAQPVIMSQSMIDAVKRFTGCSNTRDIQPINGRPIVLETGCSEKNKK